MARMLLRCMERRHARLVLCQVERAVHGKARCRICGLWLVIVHAVPTTAHKLRGAGCRHLLHTQGILLVLRRLGRRRRLLLILRLVKVMVWLLLLLWVMLVEILRRWQVRGRCLTRILLRKVMRLWR